MRIDLKALAFAFYVGACAFAMLLGMQLLFALPAHGQAPGAAPPQSLDALLTSLAVTAALVSGVVLVARGAAPRVFAPKPATEASKALCMAIAVVAGLALGHFDVAGYIGQPTEAGRLCAGFLAAAVATFGRDFATRGWRAAPKPKKAGGAS